MSLSPSEVEHIAKLARLTLTDEEKALYGEQLSAILEHFTELEKVDTDHIPPLASVLAAQTDLRGGQSPSGPGYRDPALQCPPGGG